MTTHAKHYWQKSATENAVNPEIRIEQEWTGKDGVRFRSFRIWQNEGWSNSFLQSNNGNGWITLG